MLNREFLLGYTLSSFNPICWNTVTLQWLEALHAYSVNYYNFRDAHLSQKSSAKPQKP